MHKGLLKKIVKFCILNFFFLLCSIFSSYYLVIEPLSYEDQILLCVNLSQLSENFEFIPNIHEGQIDNESYQQNISEFCDVKMEEFGPDFSSETLKCSKCDFVAHTKQNFSRHRKNHRICEICYRDFSGARSLRDYNRHIKKCGVVHQCPYCQRIFPHKSRLNEHSNSCKKKAIHICDFCNEVFKSKNDLKSHQISIHNQ